MSDRPPVDLQVLVPLYNKGPYLEAALKSILEQKTSYTYQIIISDDASIDDSFLIAKRFLQKNSDKIILSTNDKNIGCLGNTILCYQRVTSRYFTVLDPDDFWIDETLVQTTLDFFEEHPDYTVFASNTLLEQDGQRKLYMSAKSCDFDFARLDKSVGGHTSATFFRNCGALSSCLDVLRSKLGTPEERVYEGDTFRNLLHLAYGRGRFDDTPRSVYRLTDTGIWAGQSQFCSQSMNALLFLEMYDFFDGRNAAFFLDQADTYGNYAFDWLEQSSSQIPSTERAKFYSNYLSIFACKNQTLDEKTRPAFVFFLPSKSLGGYETLLTRIARALSQDLHCIVYFVDFPDGVPRKLLAGSAVTMIDYAEDLSELRIGRPHTIIVPTTLGLEMPRVADADVRVLSWWAHPKSFEWLCWRAKATPDHAKQHIDILEASKSLMFMDWACWKAAERALTTSYTRNYVPVFAPPKQLRRTGGLHDPNVINAAWLGRLDEDKAPTIEILIDNMTQSCATYPVRLHLIGDGGSRARLEAICAELPFEVIFLGTLLDDALDDYLVNNVDVMFAMGISILEAANLKIPTVFTFASTEKRESDHYLWLFDMKNFTLGCYLSELPEADLSTRPLVDLLAEIKAPNGIFNLGQRCFEYSASQHSEQSTLCRLLRTNRAAVPNADVILVSKTQPNSVSDPSLSAQPAPDPVPADILSADAAPSPSLEAPLTDMTEEAARLDLAPFSRSGFRWLLARLLGW